MLLLGVDDMVLFSSRYNEALILQVLYTVVYPSWRLQSCSSALVPFICINKIGKGE